MAQRKAPAKKKRKKSADSGALKFLCIVVAAVVITVCGICVFVSKRNKNLPPKTDDKVTETNNAEGTSGSQNKFDGNPSENTEKSADDTTVPETTKKAETTAKSSESEPSLPPTKTLTINDADWNMTLINLYYRMPEGYNPDLVYVCNSDERLDSRVAPHYEEMYNAAAKDGVYLTPCSGYRSYELQQRNFNRERDYLMSQGYSQNEAEVLTAKEIMPPGSSEHNLGLAMDIVCVEEWFENTDEFAWLEAHAADYGFIMRYARDKQDITKVIYEPWHWRYVGVEKAKEITASGLCLEEFLGDVQ